MIPRPTGAGGATTSLAPAVVVGRMSVGLPTINMGPGQCSGIPRQQHQHRGQPRPQQHPAPLGYLLLCPSDPIWIPPRFPSVLHFPAPLCLTPLPLFPSICPQHIPLVGRKALVVLRDKMGDRETLTLCPFPSHPQNFESQTCPFCRGEIKGQEAVSIHQFQEKPEEATAAAEYLRSSSDQEDGEEELGQVSRARQELELEPLGLREEGPATWILGLREEGASARSRVLGAWTFAFPRVWGSGFLQMKLP